MIYFGIDAGLTAPGFAVVKTTDENPTGVVLMTECFRPSAPEEKGSKTNFDVHRIRQIVKRMLDISMQYKPDVVVAELPTGGAKSGAAIRGMAFSTAMTTAYMEAISFFNPAWPTKYVTITPIANKKGSTGRKVWDVDPEQGKWEVFNAVSAIWPDVCWPRKKKRPTEVDDGLCFAVADALSCIATELRSAGALR